MRLDRKELKRLARQNILQASPAFWKVTLLYLLLTVWVPELIEFFSGYPLSLDPSAGAGSVFLFFLFTLLSMVLSFGFSAWALRTTRGQQSGYGTLLEGFSTPLPVIAMKLLVFLFSLLWAFLFAVLMGVAAGALLPLLSLLLYSGNPVLILLALLPFYLGILAGATIITLRYAFSSYLLLDFPQAGPAAAVGRSVAMMRGFKWQLFKLRLSFLGWYVLNALIGLAVFFLTLWPEVMQMLSTLSASEDPLSLFLYSHTILSSFRSALLASLCMLPLELWLQPYTAAANARFYVSRSSLYAEAPGSPL